MSQTVIGIFEHSSQAQDAKSYLLDSGFSSGNVDITTGSNGTSDSSANSDDGIGDRISNFFKNLFTDDQHEANSYTSAGKKGTIVTVHAATADEAMEAAEILNKYGAVDVDEFSGTRNDSMVTDSIVDDDEFSGTRNGSMETDSTDKIKIIKEDLQVGKKEVETGGVRLRSRIVERPVEESIRLREERVNIERNTVDRPATEADFSNFKEGTVELKETAERAVVAKTARVVEEISLDKEVSEREEVISDTVRHTEVDTEDIDGTDTFDNVSEGDIESETGSVRSTKRYDDNL